MRRMLLAITILAPLAVQAQERPPQTLTVEQAIRVSNGLAQLDCFQPMDGGMQQGCRKQFEISIAVRLVMARNMEKGTAVFQSYQKERGRRQKALQNEKGEMDLAARARFELEDREALEAASGVAMEHIKRDELLKESTPMPSTVLAMLLPILD